MSAGKDSWDTSPKPLPNITCKTYSVLLYDIGQHLTEYIYCISYGHKRSNFESLKQACEQLQADLSAARA